MTRLLSTLLATTALWAAPDVPGNEPAKVAPLDLSEFDSAMGDDGASGQSTDGFEEVSQEQAQEEILLQHQTRQHIDADDDETSNGVRQDEGGQVEDGGQRAAKTPAAEPAAEPAKPAVPAAADAEDETKLPQWVQDRLAREKRKTARALGELEAARKAPAPQVTETTAAPAEPPKSSDYEEWEDYVAAKALYEKSQKAAKDKPAPKLDLNDMPKPMPETLRIQVAGAIGEINAALEAHPELHKIVNDPTNPKNLKITPSMILAISETDNPASVLQAFADNPAMSAEIAGLPEAKAVARILKLDKPGAAKPAPAPAPKPQAPAPKLSTAPEPIAPLGGENRAAPSHEEADFNTFEAQRRVEESAKDEWGW